MAVQISGNDITVPRDGSFTRNVTIGGTLTYEDVTNIDSVGLVTARTGIEIGARPGVAASISVDGNAEFAGIVTASSFVGSGANLTGVANTDVIFTDKITLPDSSVGSINVGLGSDIQIFHDGSDSHIHNSTSNLRVRSNDIQLRDNAENFYVDCNNGGSVDLYHNGTKKLETASGGVTVTGTVAATSYTGDGSSLTGISVGIATTASQVSGITTVIDLSKDDIRLDCTGLVTIDTKGGTEGGSHMLRIVNVGLSTVSFSSYFKFPSGGTPALPTASGAISLISFSVHTQGRVGVASVFLAGSSVNFS